MKVSNSTVGSATVIDFSSGPINALSVGSGFVAALSSAFESACNDAETSAIVLYGRGRFCGGADIRDFDGAPKRLNAIRTLLAMIEASQKPVVAAIEGICLGGGLELALACHYRVATEGARLGFPEITLGLLPGAGGTQRAPRLIGAMAALDLMLTGRQIDASEASELGLIDQVAESDALAASLQALAECAYLKPRRSGALPAPDDLAQSVSAVRRAKSMSTAGNSILECFAAIANGSLNDGLALEAKLFGELMISDESRALRHGFFGRRQVAKIPDLSAAQPAQIASVCVVGAGLMGTGIAVAVLNAGLQVVLVDPDEARLGSAYDTVRKTLRRDVEKGRITEPVAQGRLNALSFSGSVEQVPDADLFIEAVFEDIRIKKQVFETLGSCAKPDAILASNTSTLNLNAIAGFSGRPGQVVGLHFFSPAHIMGLLEVVRADRTTDKTLLTAMAFAKAIGKTGVVAGVCDGFIGNRIMEEYLRQAWFLLEEGALPQQVDRAVEAFGMAMGPCRVMDLAGQDIGWNIRKRRAVEQPDRPYSKVPDLICELGRFGQKTGAGFYKYSDGRTQEHDPDVDALIIAHSLKIGLTRRDIGDEEIVERCIFAMINEGARVLEEGIAARPIDIDIVYLEGYGFPVERGGPMFYADQIGLSNILKRIRKYEDGRHGWAWAPASLLTDLASGNRTFAELNNR